MKKICIINYKLNNISSIKKALHEAGYEFDVVDNEKNFNKYSHIILPGVGTFDAGIEQLKNQKLFDLLIEQSKKKFIFGICLGMQLFFETSEESKKKLRGLGIIKGSVRKIAKKKKINIYLPHMGWNNIYPKRKKNLFNLKLDKNFYFANSFFCDPTDKNIVEYYFLHGSEYPAVVKKNNIYGAQFHPEKSEEGIKILKYFCSLK